MANKATKSKSRSTVTKPKGTKPDALRGKNQRERSADGFTRRERLFVAEYLADAKQNGKEAAIRAGYSAKSAAVTACGLLRKPHVAAAVEAKHHQTLVNLDITRERVLGELAKLAYFDPRNLFNEDGSAKQINELDDVTAAAVAGVEVYQEFLSRGEDKEEGGIGITKKFKLADKRGPLELLGKHLKLFTDKHEFGGPNGTPLAPPVLNVTFVKAKGTK